MISKYVKRLLFLALHIFLFQFFLLQSQVDAPTETTPDFAKPPTLKLRSPGATPGTEPPSPRLRGPGAEEVEEKEAVEEEEAEEPEVEEPEREEAEEEEEIPELEVMTQKGLISLTGDTTLNLPFVGKVRTVISARWETPYEAARAIEMVAKKRGTLTTQEMEYMYDVGGAYSLLGRPTGTMYPPGTPGMPGMMPTPPTTRRRRPGQPGVQPRLPLAQRIGRIVFEADLKEPIKFGPLTITKSKTMFATDGTFEISGTSEILNKEIRAIIYRRRLRIYDVPQMMATAPGMYPGQMGMMGTPGMLGPTGMAGVPGGIAAQGLAGFMLRLMPGARQRAAAAQPGVTGVPGAPGTGPATPGLGMYPGMTPSTLRWDFEFRGEFVSPKPIRPFKKLPLLPPEVKSIALHKAYIGMKLGLERKVFLGGEASILGLKSEGTANFVSVLDPVTKKRKVGISLVARPPKEGWDLEKISPVLKPVADVLDDYAIIASSYEYYDREFEATIKPGLTLVSKINIIRIPGIKELLKILPKEVKPAVLAGTISTPQNTSFVAKLPIALPITRKYPKITLNDFKLQVAGLPPEIGFKTAVEVVPRKKDQPLLFTGALVLAPPIGFGIEASMKGVWNDPLGFPGSLENVGFEFGARLGPPPTVIIPQKFGFTGITKLGDRSDPKKHIRIETTIYIDVLRPLYTVLYASINHLTLRDIVSLPANVGIHLPVKGIPNIGVYDVEFSFSPLGARVKIGEIIKQYKPGLRFEGRAKILDVNAYMKFALNLIPGPHMGVIAIGRVDKFNIGPLTISGAGPDKKYGTPDDGAISELYLTPMRQSLYISALVEGLNSRGNIEININTKGIDLDTRLKLFNIFDSRFTAYTTGQTLPESKFVVKGYLYFGRQRANMHGTLDFNFIDLHFALKNFSLRNTVEATLLLAAEIAFEIVKAKKEEEEKKKRKITAARNQNPAANVLFAENMAQTTFLPKAQLEPMPLTFTKDTYLFTQLTELPEGTDADVATEEQPSKLETEFVKLLQKKFTRYDEMTAPTLLAQAATSPIGATTDEILEVEEPEEQAEEAESPDAEAMGDAAPTVAKAKSKKLKPEDILPELTILREIEHVRAPELAEIITTEEELYKNLTPEMKARVLEIVDGFPDMAIPDAKFRIHQPTPGILKKLAGIFREGGIVIRGPIDVPKLNLYGKGDFRITRKGLLALLALKPWKIGALTITGRGLDKIKGNEDDGATARIVLMTEEQSFYISGIVNLWDLDSEIFCDIGSHGFEFYTRTRIFDIFDAHVHGRTIKEASVAPEEEPTEAKTTTEAPEEKPEVQKEDAESPSLKLRGPGEEPEEEEAEEEEESPDAEAMGDADAEEPEIETKTAFLLTGSIIIGKSVAQFQTHLGGDWKKTVFLFQLERFSIEEVLNTTNIILQKMFQTKKLIVPAETLSKIFPIDFQFENLNCGLVFSKTDWAGRVYEPGFTFDSIARLPISRLKTGLTCYIGKKGFHSEGRIYPQKLGALKITGAGPDKKRGTPDDCAIVRIIIGKDIEFYIDGEIDIFGLKSKTRINMDAKGLHFKTTANIDTRFYMECEGHSVGKLFQRDFDVLVKGYMKGEFFKILREALKKALKNLQAKATTDVDKVKREVDKLNRQIAYYNYEINKRKKQINALHAKTKRRIKQNKAKIEKEKTKVNKAQNNLKKLRAKFKREEARMRAQRLKCENLKNNWYTAPLYPGCWLTFTLVEGIVRATKEMVYFTAKTAMDAAKSFLSLGKELSVLDPRATEEGAKITKLGLEITGFESAKAGVIVSRETAKGVLELGKQMAIAGTDLLAAIGEGVLSLDKVINIKEAWIEGSLSDFLDKGHLPKAKLRGTFHGEEKTMTVRYNISGAVVESVDALSTKLLTKALKA